MIHLHDTARGSVEPLDLREPGRVGLYVCGPTVYGPPHLGHGRFALVFDVLRRYLAWSGLDVRYVSNITDIDDKIIDRARSEGRDPAQIAVECEALWYDALDGLGVARPDADPHATAYVERMVALVDDLLGRGVAYAADGDVLFSVASVADYGLLARQDLDSLRAGARVATGAHKRSPLDFVLWKAAKPGEPSWDAPWGAGRPGWHTECVVMSLDLLGDGFDIHGGGQDLAFPHHENERAQAVAAGRTFARHWVHNGFVEVAGEKMSKSLGNFTTLAELLDAGDPRAYRLLVLQSHYRSPLEVSPATVERAERSLAGLDAFARRAAGLRRRWSSDPGDPNAALAAAEPDPGVLAAFRAAMDDDLDTPAAMATVFDAVRRANAALDAGDVATGASLAAAVAAMTAAVGLDLRAEVDGPAVPADVAGLAARRDAARKARDFAAADALRDELRAAGWLVEDTPSGPVLRRV